MSKWLMQHELLSAVLLILGPMWIRGAVGDHNDHNLLFPPNGGYTNAFGHPELLNKLQEGQFFHLGAHDAVDVVVQL